MSKENNSNGTAHRRGAPPDPEAPIAREKLPDDLQHLVDDDESLMDKIYDGTYVFNS